MLPLIGITMDMGAKGDRYELYFEYAAGVEKGGGLPVPIAYRSSIGLIGQFVERLDGFLFTGGDDLDPTVFGEERHPKAVPVDPARQEFELALLAEVERQGKPALGICLGCQLLNVHRGGSLIQFLPEHERANALEHRKVGGVALRHPVRIEAGSLLARVVRVEGRGEISVNTSHKQAIRQVGKGLRAVATAPDGVIEAVEDPSRPMFLGVQWHPERLLGEEAHVKLFEALVRSAIDHRRVR